MLVFIGIVSGLAFIHFQFHRKYFCLFLPSIPLMPFPRHFDEWQQNETKRKNKTKKQENSRVWVCSAFSLSKTKDTKRQKREKKTLYRISLKTTQTIWFDSFVSIPIFFLCCLSTSRIAADICYSFLFVSQLLLLLLNHSHFIPFKSAILFACDA